MLNKNIIRKFIFLVFAFALQQYGSAQTCTDDYFTMMYKANNDFSILQSISTASNELVCAGNINYSDNGILRSDGWLAKMSANGTVLWSNRFKVPGFDYSVLRDIVEGSDGTYYAIGEATDTLGGVDLAIVAGIFLHIDRYGNILNSGTLNISGREDEQTYFNGISKTLEGDIFINGYNSYPGLEDFKAIILRVTQKGLIKWITTYASSKYKFKFLFKNNLYETKDGQVLTGTLTHIYDSTTGLVKQSGFHLISVNKETGEKIWDQVLQYSGLPNSPLVSLSTISYISELPGGDLSFHTSFSDSTYYNQPDYHGKSVNIITSSSGALKKAVSYYNKQPGSYTADGVKLNDNGDQLLLLDDGENSLLVEINKDGKLRNQKAFINPANNLRAVSLNHTSENTNYLFMTDRTFGNKIYLYKTDTPASIECVLTDSDIIKEDATQYFSPANSEMFVIPSSTQNSVMPYLPIIVNDFPLGQVITCRKPCCIDVSQTADSVEICDAISYTLPNNDVVTTSGNYYISYKTLKGCDSIVFYPVVFSKKPAVSLGPDNCLEGMDSILLKADTGYAVYNWMNTFTDQSSYTIRNPGNFWVSVTNKCGASSDSITIFRDCEFEIYIPSAFSPNNDNINDNFKIPKQNRNKLIELTVYNRFGALVFRTKDINAGWNGTIKNVPQPIGTYVYSIKMETLDGKMISKKGTITLIR